jgi:hypothetical protein
MISSDDMRKQATVLRWPFFPKANHHNSVWRSFLSLPWCGASPFAEHEPRITCAHGSASAGSTIRERKQNVGDVDGETVLATRTKLASLNCVGGIGKTDELCQRILDSELARVN